MEYKFNGPDGIEKKWQDYWREKKVYSVSNDSSLPKCYVLDMFPYPSGAGLHVGHPLGYIASDIYSRYKRLKGFNVLHPMGFDSFGLPAEQYALETGQHPATTTEKNIATFKAQLDKIGFCYDWEREVRTSDPQYYKWTQWIFLKLYNSYFCNTQQKARPIEDLVKKFETKGNKNFTSEQWNAFSKKEQEDILMNRRLAFSKYGEVNWCEALGTVLANDEVVNGVSERGGHPVEKKKMRQWYLRITDYADRLLEGLETVEFSDSMKEMQRNWIGKSQGAEMDFAMKGNDKTLRVYTTRPDTIFGVDFMVVAPEHELVAAITSAAQKTAIEEYLHYVKSRSERERMAEAKTITGCFTGAYAINPFDGREIPIWIAEYVLAGYGTGAIMAVPCGDQRDFSFAKYFNIPITNIIGAHFNGEEANPTKEAVLENSDFLNGLLMKDAIGVAVNKIEELGIGKRKVNYRMRDAGFSRQRYWGEPFPIIWADGIAIPLDADELPLQLPHVDKYGPGPEGQGPLANITDWVDLTPNPSPKERGMTDQDENKAPGYTNSSVEEWRKTIAFAKQNRKDATVEEDIIWQELRARKIAGFKFRRQHPVAGYIPDFVCLEKKLIIEIDGEYHNDEEQIIFDKARENWLNGEGFTMIRFTNYEVNNSLSSVLKNIEQALLNKETITEVVGSNSPLLWRGVGGEVKRETSTMPGYAGSSWYFLRYMDPNNENEFCDRKASDYWNQVDLYIGGTEHAVGHLLYSRFWTKVLYDLGHIGFDEPFKKLVNQGMIQGSSRFVYRLLEKGFEVLLANVLQNYFPEFKFVTNSKANNANFQVDFISYEKNLAIELSIQTVIAEKFERINKIDPSFNLVCISYQEMVEKFSEGSENFISWLKNILTSGTNYISKQTINYSAYVSHAQLALFTLNEYSSIHVDVNIVDGVQLNIEKFRGSRDEYKNAVLLLEDGSWLLPDQQKNGAVYTCGVEVEKMSKRYYNTVNPDDLCNSYGADTFRMYEMFLGPVEASKPWDTKGIEGVHRFLRKLWRLFNDDLKGKVWNDDKATDAELKILHRTIKKIEEDTEKFSFNTAVSAFMICVNELADIKCHKKEILENILILLLPYAPHITEELWQQLGNEGTILDAAYPILNPALLVESSKEYPVSINGKMRTTITLSLDLQPAEVEKLVVENETVQKWLEGKEPKKIIFVKNKMINVVI